jgi:GrpB-like predicted nucleotidyltransferase (UPF0157 family)
MTKKRHIKIVPYNPKWPELFKKEAILVRQALGKNCIETNHIGSTAVPGLAAKPIIDIMPVVRDIKEVDAANQHMLALGYEAKGEYGMPLRRYFRKGGSSRTHHVHVFEINNSEITRHLSFRNWMRANKEDREKYEQLKNELAAIHPYDIALYTKGKDKFIAEIELLHNHVN